MGKFFSYFIFVVALFSGRPALAVSFLVTPCETEILLANIRSLDFEHAVGPAPESFATVAPETYRELLRLFLRYPGWEIMFPNGLERGTPYKQVIEQILSLKQHIRDGVYEMRARLNPSDRRSRDFLLSVAQAFDPDRPKPQDSWVRHMHYAQTEKLRASVGKDKIESFRLEERHNEDFLDLTRRTRTIWGEVRAAALVPNLTAFDAVVENLSRYTPLFPCIPRGTGCRHLKQANVDALWVSEDPEVTLHIGEVKSYLAPLQDSAESAHWNELTHQMERLRSVGELAHAPVQLHLFLINGVGAKAHAHLTQRGIRVHGRVIP